MRFALLIAVLALAACAQTAPPTAAPPEVAGVLEPQDLTVEYAADPLGIDERAPRLSWVVASEKRGAVQSAYRIIVASHPDTLAAGRGDVWDSGRVASDQTVNVVYGGAPLASGARYGWAVRVWDGAGRPSGWSAPGRWSMGLLDAADWRAAWVGAPDGALDSTEAHAARLLRGAFELGRGGVERATAYVTGLGYYELTLNGRRVGDHVLDPGFTDYDRRVLYETYDVTDLLRPGANVAAAVLGSGWYDAATPDLFGFERAPWRAPPKLLLQIEVEYADGTAQTVVTDGSWRWATGEITYNSIRGGETIDARRRRDGWDRVGYDAADWRPVAVLAPPRGRLVAQTIPPMRVTERVAPVATTEPAPGVFVVDFGKNLTGAARLVAGGAAGQRVTMHFGEHLGADGRVDTTYSASHTYGRFQRGELVLSGRAADVYEPRFTYHGFRYVEVAGLAAPPDEIEAFAVHTDLGRGGHWESSNARLNSLHSAVRRTLLNSAHALPGEEPTREKVGWTFDAFVEMEAYLYAFDADRLYAKYLDDMTDAQDPNGHVPPVTPTPGLWRTGPDGEPGGYSDPWWGATIAYVPQTLYEFTADRRAVERAYPHVAAYLAYLRRRGVSEPGASPGTGLLLDWTLGDWLDRTWAWGDGSGAPGLTPVVQTSTAGFFYTAQAAAQMADLLGRPAQARAHRALADSVRQAFNARFFEHATGLYQAESQSAQAVPLWLGMAPEGGEAAVFDRLVDAVVDWDTTITAGFVGAHAVMEVLADRGRGDLAYTMLTNEDGPGWLYFVTDSTSTLGENLNPEGYGSGHHPYAAFVGFWLYRALAGIRPDTDAPGFKHTVVRPLVPDGLDWVRAHHDTPHGRVESAWRREGDGLVLDVTVPANTTATVWVPTPRPAEVREGGAAAADAEGVAFDRVEGGHAVFRVGSGRYRFTAPL